MKKVLFILGIIFVGCLMLLLVMGIIAARAMSQRMLCQSNMKNIALAANVYEKNHKRFPPSCHTKKILSNEIEPATVLEDDYSFLFRPLPPC